MHRLAERKSAAGCRLSLKPKAKQVAASVAAASDWRYQRRMRSMQESGGGGATRIAPLGRPAGGNDKGRPEAALVRSD
ncbi:hypothetical protein RVB2_51030 [Pseudomonas aeruginosa]|nr:hypothetical protein RVB2_51030 [Pseudomonas aeruginosa]